MATVSQPPDEQVGADDGRTPAMSSSAPINAPADALMANGRDHVEVVPEVLSFKQHMWDSFETLWQKRVVTSQSQLEGLVVHFRERAHLERQYARGMAQSVSKLQSLADEGHAVPAAMEAVICTMRNRAEQSAALADELEQDVASTIDGMLKQHSEVSRRLRTDGQRLARHWQETANAYEQSAARFAQTGLEAERAATECGAAAPERPAAWRAAAQAAMAGTRRAALARQEYCKAVQRRNAAWELHERQMNVVLSATQDMEEKRGQCFRDAAMKLAVYDTSWLRNVQYDLDSCVTEVEARSPDADLQEFIKQHRAEAPLPTEISAKSYKELFAVPAVAPKYAEVHKAVEAVAARTEARVQALRPLVRQLLSGEPGPDASEAALAELKQQLASVTIDPRTGAAAQGYAPKSAANPAASPRPTGVALETSSAPPGGTIGAAAALAEGGAACRAAFCRALRLELQAVAKTEEGTEAPEDSLPPPRKLSAAAVATFAEIITAGLDGCDLEGDAWNGRDFMVYAQALRTEGEDGRPQSVLLKVYNHKLWARVYFWEDALLVGLAEAHVRQFRQSQPTDAENAEVVMIPFLQRYISFMVALGIKQEQARGSLQQTLRKCAAFLGEPVAQAYFVAMTKEPDSAPQPPKQQ